MKRGRSKKRGAELWPADELDHAIKVTVETLPQVARGGGRLLGFLRYFVMRKHGPDLRALWAEVASFMRACPGAPVPVRCVLDHLAYKARKAGRRFTVSHDYTAYLGRLLKAWGVPVRLVPALADEVPASWWTAQTCPVELLAATAPVAESSTAPGP